MRNTKTSGMADTNEKHENVPSRDTNENITEQNKTNVQTKQSSTSNDTSTNIYFLLLIVGVILGLTFEIINMQKRNNAKENGRPKYWVYSATSNVHKRDGLLHNVHTVLERLGYEKTSNNTPWNLLWSHDYPFRVMFPALHKLQPHQKVNHFPGTGYITNKIDLATTDSKYIPKAFRFPQTKQEFLKYAAERKNALFLVKNHQHRGVMLRNVSEIDLDSGTTFVQEYVQHPFLVDGYKFDIGVYVVLTSVDPLRVYWYKGDILFRYCPEKYYPFDPANVDKYVIADDYRPVWKVPSLARLYTTLGYGMKDSFDTYVRSKGKDPSKIWDGVERAIAELFIAKEKHIVEALKSYPSPDNFFEIMRVDLVVDESLAVYLLEANMSPNLSSAHFPPNRLLFEQILYNLFNLVGVASPLNGYQPQDISDKDVATRMMSEDKNIAVWGSLCNGTCTGCEAAAPVAAAAACALCRPCVTSQLRRSLLRAHSEHLHRADFRRLVPPPMTPHAATEHLNLQGLTAMNKLQYLWYQGKCNIDTAWCI